MRKLKTMRINFIHSKMEGKEKKEKSHSNDTSTEDDVVNGHKLTLGDELLIREFKRQEAAREFVERNKEKENSKKE